MSHELVAYSGPVTNVVVYNTYADGRRLHFDVFIPTPEREADRVLPALDDQAVTHAKTFLRLIGEPSDRVSVSMCARCHIDSTGRYVGKLWMLPDTDATIWPLEGCPKPGAR